MPVPSGPGPPALCSPASSHFCAHFSVSSSGPSPLKTVRATRADSGLCGSQLPPSTPGRRLAAAPPSGHPAPQVSLLHVPCGPLFCPASPPLPAGPGRLTLSVVLPGPSPRPHPVVKCWGPAQSPRSLIQGLLWLPSHHWTVCSVKSRTSRLCLLCPHHWPA